MFESNLAFAFISIIKFQSCKSSKMCFKGKLNLLKQYS